MPPLDAWPAMASGMPIWSSSTPAPMLVTEIAVAAPVHEVGVEEQVALDTSHGELRKVDQRRSLLTEQAHTEANNVERRVQFRLGRVTDIEYVQGDAAVGARLAVGTAEQCPHVERPGGHVDVPLQAQAQLVGLTRPARA